MDFFEHQSQARRKTTYLVFAFIFVVLLIVIAIDLIVLTVMYNSEPKTNTTLLAFAQQIFLMLAGVNCIIILIIAIGSFAEYAKLSLGGLSIAKNLNATPVLRTTTDPKLQTIINITDEMAIAAGIASPLLFILENEPGINAFVAGYNPNDSVMVLTQGAIDNLSRDELQGVVAHEYSHLFNSDTTINLRLMIILGGLLFLSQAGLRLLNTNHKKSSLDVYAATIFVLGGIGAFFGTLLRAWICRQRELLADASAVQYTRNPDAIRQALIKIRDQGKTALLQNPYARSINHMCFSIASIEYLFATHPPIEERIALLGSPISSQIETPAPLAKAAAALEALPASLQDMTKNPIAAQGLIYTLLVKYNDAPVTSVKLNQDIQQQINIALEIPEVGDKAFRLILINMSIPTLKKLSPTDTDVFLNNIKSMIAADQKYYLSEAIIFTILDQHLRTSSYKYSKIKYRSFNGITTQLCCVLSYLAKQSSSDPTQQQLALTAGLKFIAPELKLELKQCNWNIGDLLSKLKDLNLMAPPLKQKFLAACVACIMQDQRATSEERELLAAICACLNCPVPNV